MDSIQARLAVWLGSFLVFVFILQWVIVNFTIHHLTDEVFQTRLQQDADSLLAALIVVDTGNISLPFVSVSDVYHRPFSGHYYRIDSSMTTLRSRSLWDSDLPTIKLELGESVMLRITGPLSQPLLIYATKIKKHNKFVSIYVAHDITDFEEDVTEFQFSYITLSLIALIILLGLQTIAIRRGLRQIKVAKQQLIAMQRGDITVLDEDAPTEIKPLVQEINRLVNLLSQRIQRSRNAMGNLAHALKAPLTVLTGTANSEEIRKHKAMNKNMLQQVDFMRQLIERELKRARLSGVSEPGKHFNVSEDVLPLIEMLETIYRSKDLAMDVNIPQNITCPLDRDDMVELFGNLLDNACKYTHKMVRVSVQVSDSLDFLVEDDGPGVPKENIKELLKRGVRIDESKIGHGLGLAIIKDTVVHYNGSIEMGRSRDLGGFAIRVVLPLAACPI